MANRILQVPIICPGNGLEQLVLIDNSDGTFTLTIQTDPGTVPGAASAIIAGAGVVVVGGIAPGGGVSGPITITSTSGNALAVGRQGTTAPVLKVDASAALVATGISITGAAAGSGVAIAAISSGGAENITIDAKSTGTINIGGVSTGLVSLARGVLKAPIIGSTMTPIATQNAAPTAAQLLGGYIEHTTNTAGGSVTTPTGANLSAAVAGLAVGDSFTCVYANIGNQTGTITAGDGNVTLRGTVAIPTLKNAILQFRNTGTNTWTVDITLSA